MKVLSKPVESITKAIFYPAKNFTIKHRVVFGQTNNDKTRKSELYVSETKTQKYSNLSKVTNLYLDTKDYLVFQYGNYNDNGLEIYISYPHIDRVKKMFRNATKWFYSKTYKDLFIVKNKKLVLGAEFKGLFFDALDLIGGTALRIEPSTVHVGEEIVEGGVLYFNDETNFIELTYEQIDTIADFLESFNLYQSSLALTNFVYSQQMASVGSPTMSSSGEKGIQRYSKMKRNKED